MATLNKFDNYKNTNPIFVRDNIKFINLMIFKTYREHTVKNISTDSILTLSESMRTLDWSNQAKIRNKFAVAGK